MGKLKLIRARRLIKGKPYLAWYISDFSQLSVESIVEAVFNYGQWEDVQKLIKILGTKEVKVVFNKIIGMRRCNLRPQTKNYFNQYFARYAS